MLNSWFCTSKRERFNFFVFFKYGINLGFNQLVLLSRKFFEKLFNFIRMPSETSLKLSIHKLSNFISSFGQIIFNSRITLNNFRYVIINYVVASLIEFHSRSFLA